MNYPHHVLHLKGNYGRVGGPETLLGSILRNLDRTRVVPTLILLHRPGRGGTPILRNHADQQEILWHGIVSTPRVAHQLSRVCSERKAHLLHAHDMRANLVSYSLTRRHRIPWIAHVHGWLGATHTWRWRVYEAIEKKLIRYADVVLVGSHAAKEEVQALGVKAVKVVPNAIEIPALSPLRENAVRVRSQLGLPPSTLIVGMAGRIHPGKGQSLLIRALADLMNTKDVKFHGLIVGEGPDLERLQRLAQDLGIRHHLTFTGYCPEVLPFVGAMDIVVAPSLKESLPLTILEAMALHRPVIASRVGDLPTVITPGENGLLVPPGDVPALRDAIVSLAGNPELRYRLGVRAHNDIRQNFSAAGMTRTLESIYADLLACRSLTLV